MELLGPKKRVRFLFWCLFAIFCFIEVRILYIHVAKGQGLIEKRERQRKRIIRYPAIRGSIFDANGSILAEDVPTLSVFLEPKIVERPKEAVEKLAGILGLSRAELRLRLKSSEPVEWIAEGIDQRIAAKVAETRLKGVGVQNIQKRVYPQGTSAASIVGFKGRDEGLEGVEKVFEKRLAGKAGYALLQKDAIGRNVPNSIWKKEPGQKGSDIFLTVDLTIQHIAEDELRKIVQQYNAVGGAVVVLDPVTGRVLALASEPGFDPANPKPYYRNRAVTYVYEPGSTLKLVMATAAIDAGQFSVTDERFLCQGSMIVGPHRIKDAHPTPQSMGMLNLVKIFRYSSNVGAAQVGIFLGPEKMRRMLKRFNFGEKLGIALNGEERGLLPGPEAWKRKITAATVSYGQGISATPLQVAAAFGTIANRGVLMRPAIIDRIVSSQGEIQYKFEPKAIRRVVSEESAATMNRLLVDVVTNGTGDNARIDGYTVAGKTGTAQIAGAGGYLGGEYISSFVGYVPAEEPKLLVLAMVERPRGAYYGGAVAAPIFREVARRALWYLNIQPTAPGQIQEGKEDAH